MLAGVLEPRHSLGESPAVGRKGVRRNPTKGTLGLAVISRYIAVVRFHSDPGSASKVQKALRKCG